MDLSLLHRRDLRKGGTAAESVLWRLLRGRRFRGLKFRRQHPLGPFILDFYCADCQLAVEADGGQHFTPEGEEYDHRRSEYLAAQGVRVIRFSNRELFEEIEGVMEVIGQACGR